jgi:hypothetical protein
MAAKSLILFPNELLVGGTVPEFHAHFPLPQKILLSFHFFGPWQLNREKQGKE